MASDAGSDVEDFESSRGRPKKARRGGDDDGGGGAAEMEQVEKKQKKAEEEKQKDGGGEDDAAAAEDAPAEEGATRGEVPNVSFVRPEYVLERDEKSQHQIYAKTLNVKDICNILTGCCSLPGINDVEMTFTPAGMEMYARPTVSPVIVSAFYSKDNFREYKVNTRIHHVISKTELDDLKKKVSKDVEFLEISANSDGYVIGGRRAYKIGGGCDFTIQLTAITPDAKIIKVDMSAMVWNLQVRTASQHFSDNIGFFDDSVEFIKLTVKPKLLEFKGIRDTGSASKSINQVIQSQFSGEYKALFNKKMLKVVTAARDINRALCISFKIDESAADFPVHFMYEMGQEKPQSHFSVYIAPCIGDDRA